MEGFMYSISYIGLYTLGHDVSFASFFWMASSVRRRRCHHRFHLRRRPYRCRRRFSSSRRFVFVVASTCTWCDNHGGLPVQNFVHWSLHLMVRSLSTRGTVVTRGPLDYAS